MPNGIPTAAQLMSGMVVGFSIDTCIFESFGFQLDTGEFGVLHQQIPPWLKLYIPSIVKREIIGHQVVNIHRAEQDIHSSIRNIQRYTGIDVKAVSVAIEDLKLANILKIFEGRLDNFIAKFNGNVVTESGSKLLHEMFERYFSLQPPFEAKKDKKHEFPDAASLLTLEYLAKKEGKLLVLVSNDDGWHKFCAQSDVMFCVKTLEDFTTLYQAGAAAAEVVERITVLLNNSASGLYKQIESALENEIPNCSWGVDAYTGYCERVDAELDWASFQEFTPNVDSLRLWLSKNKQEICVVELDLQIISEFHVTADFSAWDSIDREYVRIGSGNKSFTEEVKMTSFLTLSGNLSEGDPNDWAVQVEISQKYYPIDAGEMEPDYSDYEE